MRFDTSEMGGNWTEICAYGTAVRVRKALRKPSLRDTSRCQAPGHVPGGGVDAWFDGFASLAVSFGRVSVPGTWSCLFRSC